MDIDTFIHNHMAGLLYPFVTGLVLFLFFLCRWVVSRVMKSSDRLGEKVDKLDSKMDTLVTRVDSKLDKESFDRTVGRAFARIEEVEHQNTEMAERLTDLEWRTGLKERDKA